MDLRLLNTEQIQELLDSLTHEREVEFWGEKYIIKPCLISEVHGDGMRLVYVTPIDTRPNYYILRIDSSIEIDNDESLNETDKSNYNTIIEMLLQMIEEEHDNEDRYTENEDGLLIDKHDDTAQPFEYKWPMLCWGGGRWGEI